MPSQCPRFTGPPTFVEVEAIDADEADCVREDVLHRGAGPRQEVSGAGHDAHHTARHNVQASHDLLHHGGLAQGSARAGKLRRRSVIGYHANEKFKTPSEKRTPTAGKHEISPDHD